MPCIQTIKSIFKTLFLITIALGLFSCSDKNDEDKTTIVGAEDSTGKNSPPLSDDSSEKPGPSKDDPTKDPNPNNGEPIDATKLAWKDVKGILEKNCTDSCHKASGSKSLMSPALKWPNYTSRQAVLTLIKSTVIDGTMPPPDLFDPMAAEEKETISKWVDDGGLE